MSFSSEVKAELARQNDSKRHCQLAELAALIYFGCKISQDTKGGYEVEVTSENPFVARKYFTLLKKTYIINGNVESKALQAVKILDENGSLSGMWEEVNPVLIKRNCCRRAYLRGAFLCLGSMSDPHKGYHLEFVCEYESWAEQIRQVIGSFDLEAKIIKRKKYYVVYLKEGEGIVDLLNVMGAHRLLMELENLRVEKEVRNSINRQVNCEAANITKTVTAASKQIEAILYLQKHYGLSNLPDNLRQMAETRLEHPESSLQELGGYLNPPVGKSGVNHRLRKISEIAEKLKA